ncbi:MAG: DUF2062 domain-containing protein [Desulfobacterales bacterium]|nr:MAG: DUF2062 domain-containing protein [Desulfobacterales bacterium]
MMIKSFFHNRIGTPILNLLKMGLSPEKLSLSMACGAVIGIFPILGTTTLICAAIAIVWRLNLPAIQLSNYLVYPLQIALLIPFISFGAFIFRVDPPPLSIQELSALFQQDFWGTFAYFFGTIMHAVVAWLLVCAPVFPVLYFVLVPIFRKFKFAQAGIKSQ